jgi:hypothetical protein
LIDYFYKLKIQGAIMLTTVFVTVILIFASWLLFKIKNNMESITLSKGLHIAEKHLNILIEDKIPTTYTHTVNTIRDLINSEEFKIFISKTKEILIAILLFPVRVFQRGIVFIMNFADLVKQLMRFIWQSLFNTKTKKIFKGILIFPLILVKNLIDFIKYQFHLIKLLLRFAWQSLFNTKTKEAFKVVLMLPVKLMKIVINIIKYQFHLMKLLLQLTWQSLFNQTNGRFLMRLVKFVFQIFKKILLFHFKVVGALYRMAKGVLVFLALLILNFLIGKKIEPHSYYFHDRDQNYYNPVDSVTIYNFIPFLFKSVFGLAFRIIKFPFKTIKFLSKRFYYAFEYTFKKYQENKQRLINLELNKLYQIERAREEVRYDRQMEVERQEIIQALNDF